MTTTHPFFNPVSCSAMRAGGLALLCSLSVARDARADIVEACARAAESSQELRANDRLVESRDKLRFCARDACPVVVQGDCRKWLAEVEDALPSVVIIASDADDRPLTAVTVSVDGRPVASSLDGRPIAVDPGQHQFSFEAEGFRAITQDIVIRTAEKHRDLRVVLERAGGAAGEGPGSQSGNPTWSWVLFGVGAAALGTGTYLGLDARSDVSQMRDDCAPYCSSGDVDRARTQLLVADVALGVGVISVGAATWLALSGSDDEPGPVSVSVGPTSVSAQWGTAF